MMTMRVDGDITIDSQGRVTKYKVTTPVTPTIEKALDKAVHGWRFHPVKVDGQPANARSNMRVTLAAREASNGYAISVDNIIYRDIPKDEPLKRGEVARTARACTGCRAHRRQIKKACDVSPGRGTCGH